MKRRLLFPVPFAQTPPPSRSTPLSITDIRAWRLREPDSGRRYTIVRVSAQNGVSGFGEGGAIKATDLGEARTALIGHRATALEFVRHKFAAMPSLEAALNNALLDLSARTSGVPLYQFLGGPVRFKARLMARLSEPGQARAAQADGFRSFTLKVPPRDSMARLQAYVDAVRKSMDNFKEMAGADSEIVLDGGGALLPGDAAVVARSVERLHPIWFDEPTGVTSQDALSRIVDESTLPVGLGRHIHNIGDFQNLLRLGCVDVLRPSLALNSLHKIRRMAAIAETHYIAVAPYHDGGPLATILGIHLGGSLSNFYAQEVPVPATARDRAMRTEILGGTAERAQDGFASLVNQPGLGVRLDEQALNKYSEEAL
jgi:galactonate dehydratase